MCVIAIKNKGVDMPDYENIKDMWTRNSDGAGFMYAVDEEVVIEKGFMTLRDFTNALAGAEKSLMASGYTVKEVPFVLHFRITTHGGTSAPNTHPFPVSKDIKNLQALDIITDLGMAHNGIIKNTPRSQTISDTMEFVLSTVMTLKSLNKDFLKVPEALELMRKSINGSRLVFLDKMGTLTTVGTWEKGTVEGTEDILYSNLLHEPFDYGNLSDYAYWGSPRRTYSNYTSTPVKVKALPIGKKYALARIDDIVEVENMYDEKEQFTTDDRPLNALKHSITKVDDNPQFKRYVDKAGIVYYLNNYNKKAPMRLTESKFWGVLIQISDDGETYKIRDARAINDRYLHARVIEYV